MKQTRRHRTLHPASSPAPVGHYSPGVEFDRLVFVSGHGGRAPESGRLEGKDIEAQTEQALRNIAAVLEQAGTSLRHVLRCRVFLTDLNEFSRMDSVYESWFVDHRPARTTVEVSGLPGGMKVEIDATAYIP